MDSIDIFYFDNTAYFSMTRYKKNKVEVNASVDVEVIKLIVSEVRDEENDAFRVAFPTWFHNPLEPYNLNMRDTRAELKALMLIVAFTLLNVADIEGEESVELIPFIECFAVHEYFATANHAVAVIIFGFAASEVSRRKYFKLCMFFF